jgi:hypothetical protein
MASEFEEFHLRVTFDDQATEGLQKLRNELQQIGSIGALSGLDDQVPACDC